MRQAYERFTCDCGVVCQMIPSQSTSKLAPITVYCYDGGNIEWVEDMFMNLSYRVVPKEEIAANPDLPRHLNHWSNCTSESFHRRRAR